MLPKKARENYQNLSEEEKNKKCQNAHNPYRKLFIEKKLNEEEKQNNVSMFAIDIKIFLKTYKKKREYGREWYRNVFEEEKNKKRICAWKVIEIFLKSFTFLQKFKKLISFRKFGIFG